MSNCGYDAVSPDGRYLVGSDGVRDLMTDETIKLDLGDFYLESPVFSSDGKQFAYASCCTEKVALYELRVSPFVAKETNSVLPSKTIFRNEEYPYFELFGWSPDGKEIFAILERKDDTVLTGAISTANGTLRIIRSLEWRWPNHASLSADGRYIAYDLPMAKASRNRDIFTLATDGSGETAVVQGPGWDASPVWTPDGKSLVFQSDRSGTLGLWSIPIERANPGAKPQYCARMCGMSGQWASAVMAHSTISRVAGGAPAMFSLRKSI